MDTMAIVFIAPDIHIRFILRKEDIFNIDFAPDKFRRGLDSDIRDLRESNYKSTAYYWNDGVWKIYS